MKGGRQSQGSQSTFYIVPLVMAFILGSIFTAISIRTPFPASTGDALKKPLSQRQIEQRRLGTKASTTQVDVEMWITLWARKGGIDLVPCHMNSCQLPPLSCVPACNPLCNAVGCSVRPDWLVHYRRGRLRIRIGPWLVCRRPESGRPAGNRSAAGSARCTADVWRPKMRSSEVAKTFQPPDDRCEMTNLLRLGSR